MAASAAVVDDETARQVEEQRARTHLGELVRTEQAGVPGATVDVQADRLGPLEQLVQACRTRCALPSASLSTTS